MIQVKLFLYGNKKGSTKPEFPYHLPIFQLTVHSREQSISIEIYECNTILQCFLSRQ